MENQDEKEVPRELRTPTTEGGNAISAAWDFYNDFLEKLKLSAPDFNCESVLDPESDFAATFDAAWNDGGTDGDKSVEKLMRYAQGSDEERFITPFIIVMEIIVSYGVQAMKADESGQRELAWTFAADAQYWAGILTAAWSDRAHGVKPAAALAKLRHAENVALKEDALKYWRENIDPALPAARAANVLLRVVPLSHKKLSELISAAKKGGKKSDS
ncbi:hypothetical protein CI15_07090 [Paraburkholderia monticola]|uniref:Uncharacterized protein n=1 Tax=Paraburkholderia monticola TaxID=1399968 RepID=A0A149PYA6_9BURK|nr:hypothetical protein [Paraburkholderia monticola]KXU89936.1 hypothetical protein CI15_07090 [Paraburkholderia monticola]